jgi:hypothetical protein
MKAVVVTEYGGPEVLKFGDFLLPDLAKKLRLREARVGHIAMEKGADGKILLVA